MKMRRVLMVSAVLVLALALGAGSALAQEKVIKIGALYPLTGNLAVTGMDFSRLVVSASCSLRGRNVR